MCGKKIVSATLSVCLTSLLILSSNLEARAAAADVSRIPLFSDSEPEEENTLPTLEDLGQMAEDAANKVSDIPNREIEPMSQELVEYVLSHADDPEPVQETYDYEDEEVSTQSAIAIGAGIVAVILLLAYAGSSALTQTRGFPASVYYRIDSVASKAESWSDSFTYGIKQQLKTVKITASMAKSFLDKLDSCETSEQVYSLELTESDKDVLLYAIKNNTWSHTGYLSNINPKNINAVAVDGCKYYYILSSYFSYDPSSVYVLYTASPISFYCSNGSGKGYSLYFKNALLADQTFPFSKMGYKVASYKLSTVTGYYELDSVLSFSSESNGWTKGDYENFLSLPCPFVQESSILYDMTNFQDKFLLGSPLLLDHTYMGKTVTVDSILNLDSFSYSGDIADVLNNSKNIYGQTSALNPSAGLILDTTDKPATDKPGTGEDTGTGSGSTTGTVDVSGITAELKLIKDIVTTIQGNVAAVSSSVGSVIAELQEIKAVIKDLALAGGGTIDIDISEVTDAIESLQDDIADVRSIITTINRSIAAEKEIITSIDKQLASYEEIITDIRADVAAIPSVISDVLVASGVIADTVTDTGAAVGSKIDALPGSITDSLTQAAATDLSQAQTSTDWSVAYPLQNKFPFSIPWDVAGCITLLKAEPIDPVWKVPFVVKTDSIDINESVVIDLSGKDWQVLVKIVRGFILLMFLFSLAMVTRTLIKG